MRGEAEWNGWYCGGTPTSVTHGVERLVLVVFSEQTPDRVVSGVGLLQKLCDVGSLGGRSREIE